MQGKYLKESSKAFVEYNIYADKSSIVLDWILHEGINKKYFSIREVVRERKVSIGLVQKVFEVLVFNGILQTSGIRTSKKFSIKNPKKLLENWLDHYSIIKKCKMWNYRTGFQNKGDLIKVLKKNNDFNSKIALALHSAAEGYGMKNTNLQTLELYLLDPNIRTILEVDLMLEPQEKGYEVLLIEPYYKSLIKSGLIYENKDILPICPALIAFLDLSNFPLRGPEQAEFILERSEDLKKIFERKIKKHN